MAIVRLIWFCDVRGFGLAQSEWGGPPCIVDPAMRQDLERQGFAALDDDGLLIAADPDLPMPAVLAHGFESPAIHA